MKQSIHVLVMVVAVVEIETAAGPVEAQVIEVEPSSIDDVAPSVREAPSVPPTVRCPVAPATLRYPFGIARSEEVGRGR